MLLRRKLLRSGCVSKVKIILLILFQLVNAPVFAEVREKWVSAEPATREVAITGFTRAHATIPVATEVAGKIKDIFADVGNPIPAQGKLACLDEIFVRLDIQAADNEIAQHSNDVTYFQREVSRHEKLVAKQTIAINVLDNLNRDLTNSQRAMQTANIRKQRLSELKRRHCIEAHAGWLVIDRLIEPGQWVQEGEVIAHIGDYSKLVIPLMLSERELATLTHQDKIEVLLTEYNIHVPAKIERISPAFDESSRKIPVELSIKDDVPIRRGGIRAELILKMPTDEQTFSVPQKALEERFEEYWLQRKDGKSLKVKVVLKQPDGNVKINSPDIKAGDLFKIIR
ncbi:MAG: efflux RND transporter periplasmic adaptor subunit [Methylovulum sp.]|nr:efflux RND transporter periplasmic adaptor subunit [Methylovulum sp.]